MTDFVFKTPIMFPRVFKPYVFHMGVQPQYSIVMPATRVPLELYDECKLIVRETEDGEALTAKSFIAPMIVPKGGMDMLIRLRIVQEDAADLRVPMDSLLVGAECNVVVKTFEAEPPSMALKRRYGTTRLAFTAIEVDTDDMAERLKKIIETAMQEGE